MVTRPDSQGQPMTSEARRKMAKPNAQGCAIAHVNWRTTLARLGVRKACGSGVLGTMRKVRPAGFNVWAGSALPAPALLYSAGAVGTAGRACHRLAESAMG